ncbi:MAG: VOC family protein, partial [Pseudomonadota bacterium]|nr:VOC family protein [Pseudomonadota bacterium]
MRNLFYGALAMLVLGGCSSELSGRDPNAIIRGVHYVGLSVSDVNRAGDFYENTVDLETVADQVITDSPVIDSLAGRSGVTAQTRLLKSANAQLRVMAFDNPSEQAQQSAPVDVYGPGIAHVCYQVNQTTEAYQKFLKAGGKAIGDPEMMQINPRNPVYYAYAHDLDNAIVEIEHVDVAQLNLPSPPKYDYRVRQVALST